MARDALAALGHGSTVDYLASACRLVLEETGLLPHANAGALLPDELATLRRVSASQGMMLESLSERLHEPGGPHARCQTKLPARRLATLEAAGELAIPFTTGILVGIGETRAERLEALAAIGAAHRRHGHVQEVIVQNFRPKPGTAMAAAAPPAQDDYLWTIAAARVLLDPGIHLQAPPNLTEDFGVLLEAGIDDWGGVSPVTADHVNPEAPWPALDRLRAVTEAAGMTLAPRLTIYPEYAADPGRWLDPDLRFPVLDRSDAESLARDDRWAAGDPEPPPLVVDPARFPSARAGGRVGEVLAGVAAGQRPGEEELVALFAARGPEVRAVAEVADDLRRQAVGDVVTFVRNRNINYTNVCTFRCRFCAFSKGPASLNLRGAPYLLGLDEVARRVVEADERGATEVTLQGRHPPQLRRRLLPARGRGRARGRARHAHPRLHRPRGPRGRPAAGRAAPRLPAAAQGGRPGQPARHRRRDPRRRGQGGHLPRQGDHRGVAGGPPGGPLGGAALQHHHHVRPCRVAPALGQAPAPDPGPPGRDGRVHRVRAPAVRAHGRPHVPQAPVPARADLPRDGPDPRRRPDRLPRADRQHPGVVGQDGRRRGPPGPAGRGQRPRRHADGREHQPRRRGRPRPAHGGGRVPGHRRAARPPPGAAHHPLRPHPHRTRAGAGSAPTR